MSISRNDGGEREELGEVDLKTGGTRGTEKRTEEEETSQRLPISHGP